MVCSCTLKRRRAATRDEDQSEMLNLPIHILIEIISRLPIKTVMALRCVSKSLLSIVSEPYFMALHSTRAPTEHFLRHSAKGNTLYVSEPEYDCHVSVSVAVDIKFSLLLDLPSFYGLSKSPCLVNSCNGLVCYCGPYTNKFAVICNPITGEYVTVPGPDRKDKTIDVDYTLYGLGFSSKDNRFKLLCLLWKRNVDGRIRMFSEIYTFGESGSWKSIGDCPDASFLSANCTFYEGVLHWYSRGSGDIRTFDFDSEEFGKINSPYLWAEEMEVGDFTRLGVLGDCLYKTVCVGDCVQVWVMKEYGVQSSWVKAFSIHKDIGYSRGSYEPIKYLQNGEILMLSGHEIVCYNPDTGSIRIIGSSGDLGCEAIPMRPSLVSLKVLLGDSVKARNARSRGAHRKLREVAVISPWLTRLRFVSYIHS